MGKAQQFMNEVIDAGLAGAARLENRIGGAYNSIPTSVSNGMRSLKGAPDRFARGFMRGAGVDLANAQAMIKAHPYRAAGIVGALGLGAGGIAYGLSDD